MKRKDYLKAERKVYEKYSSPDAKREEAKKKEWDALRKAQGFEPFVKRLTKESWGQLVPQSWCLELAKPSTMSILPSQRNY